MLTEHTKYTVFLTENEFEIRDYESHILAESIVDGEYDDAGERAFNRLYWFISGDNLPCEKKARAMPLSLRSKSEKIRICMNEILKKFFFIISPGLSRNFNSKHDFDYSEKDYA